jgi:transposase
MKRLTVKSIKEMLEVLEETRETLFKDRKTGCPYSQWEQKRAQIKRAPKQPAQYVHQAVETINKEGQKMGGPQLDLEKKANLFIMVRFLNKSNRMAEQSLHYFQPLFGVDVSYKYIERLYSDPEVKLVLHNVFVLLLKGEGAVSGELSGDGTGYAVSVENHYRTGPQKYGKKFVHFFSLIDLSSGMYMLGVGCLKYLSWRLSKKLGYVEALRYCH